MYPNPQDVLPLPPRANSDHYRKLAKDLVKACKSGAIAEWTRQWLTPEPEVEEFARKRMARCRLSDAQFVIARVHGFVSWPKFAAHLESLERGNSPVSKFELAAEAIIAGDEATLARLLREDPALIRARSTREHRSTLLHYVAANGVENYRQKTPRNAVKIAEVLLDAGAEVDAHADMYGGGCTTLGLVATSVHPEKAGVQNELMALLLDRGAALDAAGVDACLANGRGPAAEFLAARGAPLDFEGAAGVGRLDVVEKLLPNTPANDVTSGFMWACTYGRTNVVRFLLDAGFASATHDGRFTGLHLAAGGGHLDIVNLLLERSAPLEVENMFGGTVLGHAMWGARNGVDPDAAAQVIETLIAAGAKVPARVSPINERVDAVLVRSGIRVG